MKPNGILRTLLVTTSLSTVTYGMESGVNARTPDFNLLDPDRPSFVARAATNTVRDVRGGIVKDTQESLELLTKAWNGEWSSLAGVGIQEVIDQFNGQLLSRFNPQKNENGDFNPKSFSPFLKAFREKATALLQDWLGKNRNSYALNLANGEHYPIFNDTPFNQLAGFLIPDCMPMKGLFISICNADPINNYLANKLDEMAIAYLLNLYASFHKEDAAVKDVVAADILNGLRTGADLGHQAAKQIYQAAMTDYDNYESLPPLTAEEDQKYSPVFTYLQPRFNHFAREALTSLFLDVTQSVSELVINQGIQVALENPLIINGVKGAALLTGSYVGSVAGGLAGGYFGFYGGVAAGSAAGYKFAGMLGGGDGGRFVGGLIGAPVGGAVGWAWGGIMGTLAGAGTGAATAFAYTPRIVTHATTSLAQTAKQEVKEQLKLLVDYNIYKLLPLTEAEHVLYYLNPEPTLEEKAIYASDYARREQLLSQSFAGELIKQFIDLNGDSYLALTLNGIGQSYRLFIDYCLSSKDSTAREILEKANISDSSSSLPQEGDSERAWRAFVVRTANPSKRTGEDKKLQENLVTFPSYKAKQQYLAQLSAYMNSLSQQDLNAFAENFRGMKASVEAKESRIKKIGEVVGDAGNRIAAAHQRKAGQTLSQDNIEIIRRSAQALWDTATPAQVDRLVRMLEEDNLTLDAHSVDGDYLKNALDRYVTEENVTYLRSNIQNGTRFELLRNASLAENLEDADIVDILRTLDEIGDSLPQETKGLLSRISDKKEDSVAQAKRHELKLIKDKYESLLSAQFKVLFIRAFNNHFGSVVQEMGQEILKSEVPLSEGELYSEILNRLSKNLAYDRFLGEMVELSNSRSQGFFDEASSQIMAQTKGIAERLVKEKEAQGVVSPVSSSISPSSSSWIWWSSSTSSSENSKLQQEGGSFVDPRISEMKVYDQYDIGGFKLKEIINGLKKDSAFGDKGLDTLDAQDFEKIYEVIQTEKISNLSGVDRMFLEHYKDELMQFRMSEKSLENKLFYGYMDVIQDIRNQNKKILDSIQNLKK